MEIIARNHGLLLSGALIAVAAMFFVSARSTRERVLAIGILTQAVSVAFTVGGVFFQQQEFAIGALAAAFLFGLWSIWSIRGNRFAQPKSLRSPPDDPKDSSWK